MKTYETYKESGVEWIGEVPNNWRIVKLKWISEIYAGGTPSTTIDSYWTNGTIPWLNSGTINQKRITTASSFITEEALANSSTKWVNKGSILMALAGQGKTKGMVAILEFDATCNQSMGAIEIHNKEVLNEFILFWLESNYLNIRSMGGGDKRDGLNLQILGNIKCPFPSLEEQTQIAKYLDYKTQIIDALIEKKEHLIKKLQDQRQAIINEAVTKGLNPNAKMKDSGIEWLGEIPEHWKVVRIGHYVNIFRGASPRPAGDPTLFKGGFMPWITVGEVTNGNSKYLKSTKYFLTELGSKQSRIVYPETLLLSNSGATLGVPKITLIKGCINDGSVGFASFNSKLDRDYLFHFFMTHTKTYREEMAGYGQPNLNTDIIKSTRIPLPPIEEQQRIIEFIEKSQDNSSQIIKKSQLSIKKLKSFHQSIISEAVTGKIDVRDW